MSHSGGKGIAFSFVQRHDSTHLLINRTIIFFQHHFFHTITSNSLFFSLSILYLSLYLLTWLSILLPLEWFCMLPFIPFHMVFVPVLILLGFITICSCLLHWKGLFFYSTLILNMWLHSINL